jgi:hypothetical protein
MENLNELIKKYLKTIKENKEHGGNYMFFSNLEQIKRQCELLLKLDQNMVNELLDNGHDWADDHIATAKENMDQVFDFMMNETKGGESEVNEESDINENCWEGYKRVGSKMKNGKKVPNCVPINEARNRAQQAAIAINMKKEGKKTIISITEDQFQRLFEYNEETPVLIYEDEDGSVQNTNFELNNLLNEAEYQGKKVQLGKIMQGDIKKFKVYVKNDKGKVVKVNFGFGGKSAHGKRMVIKKNNPARRKSFRARMNCDNPGPRWKPRYWACRRW